MHQQNQIERILGRPEAIRLVRSELASKVHRNRASLSSALCQHFDFHDARGRHQIGGFAFNAAALKLRERDQWFGWDTGQRRQHLQRFLGMSRFLLRTSVHCHNLASTVLGRCCARSARILRHSTAIGPGG
jgi:hypothetical protein